jgi:hypothetical protein
MRHLSRRLQKLTQEAEREMIVFELQDGSTARFPKEALGLAFDHESDRWKRYTPGEDPGPAHPFTKALKEAKDLPQLMHQYGTCVGLFAGMDAKMREAREAREKS